MPLLKLVTGTLMFDGILVAQIVGKKHQGLGVASKKSNDKSTPRTASATMATKDDKAMIGKVKIKRRKKGQLQV